MVRAILVAVGLVAIPLQGSGAETVIRLRVEPMAAPVPALKYQLLPEVRELNPGNPAHSYLRCFAEQRRFFFSKEGNSDRARYLAMSLDELRKQKIREYGGQALRQADWGARLEPLDWQLVQQVQTDQLDSQTQEMGRLQLLATGLQVRFRLEVAQQRFDDAIRTGKTMFALARHLGEYPALPANLLGVTVAESALGVVEEMVQQAGCPNLYWALTNLPCPLVETRKAFEGSRSVVEAELRPIREDAPMTAEQMEQFVGRLSGRLGFARAESGQPPRNIRSALGERCHDAEQVRAARARLVRAGRSEALMQKLPPCQVVLLDEKREYEVQRDEVVKLLGLAPWQIDGIALFCQSSSAGKPFLLAEFLPDAIGARRAQGRLEQHIGLLRHVEALRLYAAEHDGTLPSKLSDLGTLLPWDPFTGKPYTGSIEGTTARLQGAAPRGEEQNPCFNVRYEVTIKKR